MNGQGPLRDLEVRPLEAADAERLGRFLDRLTPATVYRRFFTLFPKLPPSILRYFATADHEDHERLAVLSGDEIVAVASWDRPTPGGDAAEIAILVEDIWQHRGLGRFLMRRLTTEAAEHGMTTLTATVLTENQPARRLAASLARPQRVDLDGPETHFTYRVAS